MKHVLLVVLGGLLVNCDPPSDLGKPCALLLPDGGFWTVTSPTDDYYYSGTPECENLICLRPAASPLDAGFGFCSGPCSPKNPSDPNSASDDCSGGTSAASVCRAVALDQTFINLILSEPNGQALLQQYLGGSSAPILCTSPQSDGGSGG